MDPRLAKRFVEGAFSQLRSIGIDGLDAQGDGRTPRVRSWSAH